MIEDPISYLLLSVDEKWLLLCFHERQAFPGGRQCLLGHACSLSKANLGTAALRLKTDSFSCVVLRYYTSKLSMGAFVLSAMSDFNIPCDY